MSLTPENTFRSLTKTYSINGQIQIFGQTTLLNWQFCQLFDCLRLCKTWYLISRKYIWIAEVLWHEYHILHFLPVFPQHRFSCVEMMNKNMYLIMHLLSALSLLLLLVSFNCLKLFVIFLQKYIIIVKWDRKRFFTFLMSFHLSLNCTLK